MDTIVANADSAEVSGGARLANPVGIVQTPDRLVYVLDRAWKKVVVFNGDGALVDVYAFRHGEGPGELLDAIHLAEAPGQRLAILDHSSGRVTFIAPSGDWVGTTTLGAGSLLRIAFPNDSEVWGLYSAGPSAHNARVWMPTGELLRDAMPRSQRDIAVGSATDMVAHGGRVYMAHRQPGTWTVYEDQSYVRRGTEVFPELLPIQLHHPQAPPGGITEWPARSVALGRYASDRIGLYYTVLDEPIELDPARGRPLPRKHYLDVFTALGQYLGTSHIPVNIDDIGAGIDWSPFYAYWSPVTGRLFLPMYVPYVAVVEFELVERTL